MRDLPELGEFLRSAAASVGRIDNDAGKKVRERKTEDALSGVGKATVTVGNDPDEDGAEEDEERIR